MLISVLRTGMSNKQLLKGYADALLKMGIIYSIAYRHSYINYKIIGFSMMFFKGHR